MGRNEKLTIGLVVGVITLLIGCSGWYAYGTDEVVVVTVTRTERVTTGSGENLSSKYLVFTSGETFENSDTIWYGKWNSSDLHGRIQEGQLYELRVYGWRVPFLSQYRNIVSVVGAG